jgi:D-amino-acid dehydrogenase
MSGASDVVVIGGGIVGASVAYNAARAGLSVTLVDRADEGYATAAGAGIIAPGVGHHQDSGYNALVARAAAYYPTLIAWLAADGEEQTGYDVVGSLLVATTASEAEYLLEAQHFADDRRSAGVQGIGKISMIDGRRAQALFPALADVSAALHIAGTARVDGRLMRAALRRAAERHGARIVSGDVDLGRAGSRVRVTVDGQPLPAENIVLASGAWTASLGETLGVTLPVFPQRGQIVHLELPETDTSRWPVVLPMRGHYLLTFPPNRVVAGATRENDAGFDYRMTAGGVYDVLGQALRVAPGLSLATLREVRIGFRPATPDGLPILGRVPSFDHLYVATGHGPNGLTLGPQAGAMIVDLIRGAAIDLDLTPYAVERFQGLSPRS